MASATARLAWIRAHRAIRLHVAERAGAVHRAENEKLAWAPPSTPPILGHEARRRPCNLCSANDAAGYSSANAPGPCAFTAAIGLGGAKRPAPHLFRWRGGSPFNGRVLRPVDSDYKLIATWVPDRLPDHSSSTRRQRGGRTCARSRRSGSTRPPPLPPTKAPRSLPTNW